MVRLRRYLAIHFVLCRWRCPVLSTDAISRELCCRELGVSDRVSAVFCRQNFESFAIYLSFCYRPVSRLHALGFEYVGVSWVLQFLLKSDVSWLSMGILCALHRDLCAWDSQQLTSQRDDAWRCFMQFKNFASLEGSLTVVRGAILRGLTCVAELLEIDLWDCWRSEDEHRRLVLMITIPTITICCRSLLKVTWDSFLTVVVGVGIYSSNGFWGC